MKNIFIAISLIAVVSMAWFTFKSSQNVLDLERALSSKDNEVTSLVNEITALKKQLKEPENQLVREPTVNSLIDDASGMLTKSLSAALKGVQSELDRAKNTLDYELEDLELYFKELQQNNGGGESGDQASDQASDQNSNKSESGSSNHSNDKKHST